MARKSQKKAPKAAIRADSATQMAVGDLSLDELLGDAELFAALQQTPAWKALRKWLEDTQRDYVEQLVRSNDNGDFKRGVIFSLQFLGALPQEVVEEANQRKRAVEAIVAKDKARARPPVRP